MKKILGLTTIRSDYDLLSPLYKKLNEDKDMEIKLLVAGAHLSISYGESVKNIKTDGIDILCKLETLIDSDSKRSRLKSASILLQNSIDIVAQYDPDLIIYAGDREDVILGGLLGGYLEIPTVHFYGGDHTKDGYIDNSVRHATSKLSTIHMVSTSTHKERLKSIGEAGERIYKIGSIALDNFKNHKSLNKKEIFSRFQNEYFLDDFALVIFHPISEDRSVIHHHFENILKVLEEQNVPAFVSYPNIDPGNKKIIKVINKYREKNTFIFYKNLERNLFLSIYKNANLLIGNSSSGILEAASVPIPVVNVGRRQMGRYAPKNVIFCDAEIKSIRSSVKKALSFSFLSKIKNMFNPYGDGNSAQKAYEVLKHNDFQKLLYKAEDPLEININNEIGDSDE